MTLKDSWYEIVEGESLEQGDLITACPMFVPDYPIGLIEQLARGEIAELSDISGEWRFYNSVIMSQTCDLENGKLKYITMCPYWSLTQFGKMGQDFQSPKTLEEIKRGNRPGYFMLDACTFDGKQQEEQIVDFRSLFDVPYEFLKLFALAQGERLRLLSPYKEDLSQAFGKYFMRVARPKNIRAFRK